MRKKLTIIMVLAAAVLLSIPVQAQNSEHMKRRVTNGQALSGQQPKIKLDAATLEMRQKATAKKEVGKRFQAAAPVKWAPAYAVATKKLPLGRPILRPDVRMPEFSTFNQVGKVEVFKNGPMRAETVVDDVITSPDDGTLTHYTRSGSAWYPNGAVNTLTTQDDMAAEIVETTEGVVYVKDMVSQFSAGTWVKGTKDGNVITFPVGQNLRYDTNYGMNIMYKMFWAKWDDTQMTWVKNTERTEVTFTVNGDQIALNESDENNILGVFYEYNGKEFFDGSGDFNTVYTVNNDYQEPGTTLVELPEGATVEEWYAKGSLYSGGSTPFSRTNNVAFVDNDVYVQGLFTTFPEAWVKGTKEGNLVTFDAYQYLGYISNYDLNFWVIATNGTGMFTKFHMLYNEEEETLTLDKQLLCNASYDTFYYIEWLEAITLSKNPPPVVTIDELPFVGSFDTAEDIDLFTIVDNNGDTRTWAPYSKMMRYAYHQTNAGDDWLISPAIKLVAGKKYHFSINVHNQGASYPEKFEVKIANDKTAEALAAGAEVIPATTVTHTAFQPYENNELVVDETGYYYIGIHAISDANQYYLFVDDFLLEAVPITPPYTADFSTEDPMGDFMVLDANEDGTTWTWGESYGANYAWNSANNANDYLILPIVLTEGEQYNVLVSAFSSASFAEKFEVVAGTEPTAEAMTTVVIPETECKVANLTDYEGAYTATSTGVHYIAIHATSDADMFRLKVMKFVVEKGLTETAPAAPLLNVTPVDGGELYASVEMTVPTLDISGNALAEGDVTKVELLRDGNVICTWNAPALGMTYTFTDTESDGLTDGEHVYQAIPYDRNGELGQKSEEVKVYVGLDTPAPVTEVEVEDLGTNVNFTWTEVGNVGAHGGYVNPAEVDYKLWTVTIMDFFGMQFPSLDEEIGNAVGTDNATVAFNTDEGEQRYQYFAVQPTNRMGEGGEAYAALLAGAPYELPLQESFTDQSLHYVWLNNGYLGVTSEAVDDDGVALALTSEEAGTSYFVTGKLGLKGTNNPVLVFSVKSETISQLIVAGSKDGADLEALQTIDVTNEYQTITIPLNSLKDCERYAQIGFFAYINNPVTEATAGDNVIIDNINIADISGEDLAITVTAPEKVHAGETAEINTMVENLSATEITGYTVTVKADGEVLLTETVNEAIAPFAQVHYPVNYVTTIFDDDKNVAITAEVTYANDADNSNNSATINFDVIGSTAQPPLDVTAEENEEGVVVTWTEPVEPAAEKTEDFEEDFGDFTSIDNDADGYKWEHHLNATGTGIHATTSGIGSIYSESYVNNVGAVTPDNWIVTPKAILEGTFKFWACGQDESWVDEHFAVYVSTTSPTDVSTFEQVSEEFVAVADMTEYSVDLSAYNGQEGWIAIRHFNCTDMFMLVVDDVTYTAAAKTPVSYNIYVDGELYTTVDGDTTVTLHNLSEGNHTISVSAVYDDGKESKPVSATVDVTGIVELVIGGQPVDVYTIDGKLIRKQADNLNGLKGVYIVNGKKVSVK